MMRNFRKSIGLGGSLAAGVMLLSIAAVPVAAVPVATPQDPAPRPAKDPGPQPGQRAPELPEIEAWIGIHPVSLAELRGRIVILEFFSPQLYETTYSGSVERLGELQEDFARRGVVFLAIAPELSSTLEDFARDQGAGFPLLADPSREAMKAFGVRRLGRSFVIDPEGILRWTGFADLGREIWLREIAAIASGETRRAPGGSPGVSRSGSLGLSASVSPSESAGGRPGDGRSSRRTSRRTRRAKKAGNPIEKLSLERSWDRARRRALETGETILAIVTAGEDPADRALGEKLYRSSSIRKLAAKHVLLLACPDRHEERVVTEGGVTRRVCTRFGSGSCREHQQVARDLDTMLVRQADGSALSPQHLVLDAEGTRLDAVAGAISRSRLQAFLHGAARARSAGSLVAMGSGRG